MFGSAGFPNLFDSFAVCKSTFVDAFYAAYAVLLVVGVPVVVNPLKW